MTDEREGGPVEAERTPADKPPKSTALAQVQRILVPSATTEAHALGALALGFVVEGGTELYQFLARQSLGSGPWWTYDLSIVTTFLGFYLMFRGFHEWRQLQDRRAPATATTDGRARAASARGEADRRKVRREALLLFAVGVLAVALWDLLSGGPRAGSVPFPLAWIVGGAVVLAFTRFFLGLARLLFRYAAAYGRSIAVGAVAWSFGTSVIAGLLIGDATLTLLVELFSNWGALIASFAPIVVAISPLFVPYALLTVLYVRSALDLGRSRPQASR